MLPLQGHVPGIERHVHGVRLMYIVHQSGITSGLRLILFGLLEFLGHRGVSASFCRMKDNILHPQFLMLVAETLDSSCVFFGLEFMLICVNHKFYKCLRQLGGFCKAG